MSKSTTDLRNTAITGKDKYLDFLVLYLISPPCFVHVQFVLDRSKSIWLGSNRIFLDYNFYKFDPSKTIATCPKLYGRAKILEKLLSAHLNYQFYETRILVSPI